MLARFNFGRYSFFFAAVALVFGAMGARSLNPRELYREMYPVEPVKQDAFRICDEADPTFVRAVGAEREACYNKMPHVMAVAMGRIRPGGALSVQALTDPAREAELLMTLAAMPPRQPIIERRSFSNTAWVRALSPPCNGKSMVPAIAYTTPGTPPPPGPGRVASLDEAIRNILPLPQAARDADAPRDSLPVITLVPSRPSANMPAPTAPGGTVMFDPLPAPDVGDAATPAIVPLAPANSCGGA